jgi:hypothetical protein
MWKLPLAIGCLAFSAGATYCALRLIRIQHPDELPRWAELFLGLTFIASLLLSACLLSQYFSKSR